MGVWCTSWKALQLNQYNTTWILRVTEGCGHAALALWVWQREAWCQGWPHEEMCNLLAVAPCRPLSCHSRPAASAQPNWLKAATAPQSTASGKKNGIAAVLPKQDRRWSKLLKTHLSTHKNMMSFQAWVTVCFYRLLVKNTASLVRSSCYLKQKMLIVVLLQQEACLILCKYHCWWVFCCAKLMQLEISTSSRPPRPVTSMNDSLFSHSVPSGSPFANRRWVLILIYVKLSYMSVVEVSIFNSSQEKLIQNKINRHEQRNALVISDQYQDIWMENWS